MLRMPAYLGFISASVSEGNLVIQLRVSKPSDPEILSFTKKIFFMNINTKKCFKKIIIFVHITRYILSKNSFLKSTEKHPLHYSTLYFKSCTSYPSRLLSNI